ncbi:unnamed protein product [Cylicocyclus nassatus]|uniref:Protein kinase domain-containing protein n=1 Tax=Cylicocyclus nassatus TaxID=53992 RepID=A0AA36MDR9_CYLNA|nr:unnamed protein product [Cylicocyclus nassatus]
MWISEADAYLARPPQKFTIDNDNSSALVTARAPGGADALMHNQILRALFAAFLDVFCESMPTSNGDYLKHELGLMLAKMNIVPGVVLSDEFLSLRRKFASMVSGVLKNCFFPDPTSDSRIRMENFGALSSRYAVDFQEFERIGSGGFGTVWKVKCLIDRCFYAVKKIPLKTNSTLTVKLLNEVHLLASLQHENIVRYHCGWLEMHLREPALPRQSSSQNSVIITEVEDDELAMESPLSAAQVASSENEPALDKSCGSSTSSSLSSRKPGRFWARRRTGSEAFSFSQSSELLAHASTNLNNAVNAITVPSQASPSISQNFWGIDLYIQMELCTSNLDKYLRRRNKKATSTTDQEIVVDGAFNYELSVQMLSALEFIHQKGIIHRDIKPSNIFLKRHKDKLRFLLGDFGLACEHHEVENEIMKETGDAVSFRVKHTSGIGTRTYAAPEQLNSGTYGPAVDIFGAGLILFEVYSVFYTSMEKLEAFGIVRERKTKDTFIERFPSLFKDWPSMAHRIFDMTEMDPSRRPTAAHLVQELLSVKSSTVDDLKAIICCQKKQLSAAYKMIHKLQKRLQGNSHALEKAAK